MALLAQKYEWICTALEDIMETADLEEYETTIKALHLACVNQYGLLDSILIETQWQTAAIDDCIRIFHEEGKKAYIDRLSRVNNVCSIFTHISLTTWQNGRKELEEKRRLEKYLQLLNGLWHSSSSILPDKIPTS